MDTLQITIERGGEVAVMYLQGRSDIESSPHLRDQLLALLRRLSPAEEIIIDLEAVSYMDTSGLATLIEGLKIARLGGITMRLQGLQGRLLHLFQATGLGSLFGNGVPENRRATTAVS